MQYFSQQLFGKREEAYLRVVIEYLRTKTSSIVELNNRILPEIISYLIQILQHYLDIRLLL